jgi:hypothetical protein
MAVSKMLGHASFVMTLTVYADYITEGDGGRLRPCVGPPLAGRRAMWCRCADRVDRSHLCMVYTMYR